MGPRAPGLTGAVDLFGLRFPSFDLFLIALGPLVFGSLWLLFRRTPFGVLVRAATQDREMVAALGVNQKWLFTGVLRWTSFLPRSAARWSCRATRPTTRWICGSSSMFWSSSSSAASALRPAGFSPRRRFPTQRLRDSYLPENFARARVSRHGAGADRPALGSAWPPEASAPRGARGDALLWRPLGREGRLGGLRRWPRWRWCRSPPAITGSGLGREL